MEEVKPRLLDLFCGAGGAAMGYHRAGFEVVGVDIKVQPRYPFEFHRGDALEFVREHGNEFDAIHASPPCQAYSALAAMERRGGKKYPDLVAATRERIWASGKIYVIENVVGAPLLSPVMLCGEMFGLRVVRHRLFETDVFLMVPPHPRHHPDGTRSGNKGDGRKIDRRYTGYYVGVYGGGGGRGNLPEWRAAMGIDWMTPEELCQAIPPAYTEYIGEQLMWHLEAAA